MCARIYTYTCIGYIIVDIVFGWIRTEMRIAHAARVYYIIVYIIVLGEKCCTRVDDENF